MHYIPIFLIAVVPLCFLFGAWVGKYIKFGKVRNVLFTFFAVLTGFVWAFAGALFTMGAYFGGLYIRL